MTYEEAAEASSLLSKLEWTYEEFNLFTSVLFITKDSCFPCLDWNAKLICSHLVAIRKLIGIPLDHSPDDSLLPAPKRGRPKKRKPPTFNPNYKRKKNKKQKTVKDPALYETISKKLRTLQQERQERKINQRLGDRDEPITEKEIPLSDSSDSEADIPLSMLSQNDIKESG